MELLWWQERSAQLAEVVDLRERQSWHELEWSHRLDSLGAVVSLVQCVVVESMGLILRHCGRCVQAQERY